MADVTLSQSGMPRNADRGTFGKSPNRNIPIGSKFQRLTTTAMPFVNGKSTMVDCSCECGGSRTVRAAELINGVAIGCKSCPIVVSDAQRKAIGDRTRTHGMCRTPEYHLWCSMRARCGDPTNMSYADYGGRGISVCDRWMVSFEDFLTDVGMRPSKKHTMDRIDVNGNYEPGNTRWATMLEQARNTRRTLQIMFRGRLMGTAEIAKTLGVTPAYAWRKLKKHGMSIEQFEATIEHNRANRKPQKYIPKPVAVEFQAWKAAKRRCENPKDAAYKEYGGRGISMSPEWSGSYEQFYADMGPRPAKHSLDRIDNEKGYSKENCRWATIFVQNRNRRNNVLHEFRGEMVTKAEIARALGINPTNVGRFINRAGLTADEIEERGSSPLARRKKIV